MKPAHLRHSLSPSISGGDSQSRDIWDKGVNQLNRARLQIRGVKDNLQGWKGMQEGGMERIWEEEEEEVEEMEEEEEKKV